MSMENEEKIAGCVGCFFVLLVIFAVIGSGFVGCDSTYSNGFRDGYVQKFSSKGIVFKSWEGELALPGMSRSGDKLSGVWEFSVDDPVLIQELENISPDELVRVHYRQILKNAPAFHSTDFRVISIEHIKRTNNRNILQGSKVNPN